MFSIFTSRKIWKTYIPNVPDLRPRTKKNIPASFLSYVFPKRMGFHCRFVHTIKRTLQIGLKIYKFYYFSRAKNNISTPHQRYFVKYLYINFNPSKLKFIYLHHRVKFSISQCLHSWWKSRRTFGRIREQFSENLRRSRGFSPAREFSQNYQGFHQNTDFLS